LDAVCLLLIENLADAVAEFITMGHGKMY